MWRNIYQLILNYLKLFNEAQAIPSAGFDDKFLLPFSKEQWKNYFHNISALITSRYVTHQIWK